MIKDFLLKNDENKTFIDSVWRWQGKIYQEIINFLWDSF